jgi:membrane protease YdiL (CAAX protease family)
MKNIAIAPIIIVLGAAPQILLAHQTILGTYATTAAFVALVALSVVKKKWRTIAISTAILPLSLIIGLSLPRLSNFDRTLVFYSAILLLSLVYRYLFSLEESLKKTALTLKGYIKLLPYMFFAGQILGVIGYGLLQRNYSFAHESLPLVAGCAVLFAITEEMFFRGLIQQQAAKVFHPSIAVVLSALFSGLIVYGQTTLWASVFGLLLGVVLAITYYKKQNLILTITINASTKLAYIAVLATFVFRK